MLFKELERVDNSKRFIDATSDRMIIDELMADNSLTVDQEHSPVGNHLACCSEIAIVIKTELSIEHIIG